LIANALLVSLRSPRHAPVASVTTRDQAKTLPPKSNLMTSLSYHSVCLTILLLPVSISAEQPNLKADLQKLRIPQPWLAKVKTSYDYRKKPWKEGRQEIRRLLGLNKPEAFREAIKLTWLYLQKKDIGDGHEYPMYMYMGGEMAWAVKTSQQFIASKPYPDNAPIHAHRSLASLYIYYGLKAKAVATIDEAMKGLPKPPWRTMREADLNDSYGDIYAAFGDYEKAKFHYQKSARLYPTAKPKYGRHLLKRRAQKVLNKLDLLTARSLDTAKLRDGVYNERALGYTGDINLTVIVKAGRIADIKVRHKEKIDQNACKLVPRQITALQKLKVDAITGATVTQDAIQAGTFRALKKAGLK
jgi:uncharacterized protein with FMN-binding domain